jgi:hypothetical protein
MMIEMRHMARQPIADTRSHRMNVISFKRLDWTELTATIVDLSPQGVGIVAQNKMEPGFVWFREKVDGSRGGLLMWSRQLDNKYRGGIRLVPLSPEDEQIVQKRIAASNRETDPTIIVDTILDSLKKSGGSLA